MTPRLVSQSALSGRYRRVGGDPFADSLRIANRVEDADLLEKTWSLEGDGGEALEPATCVLCGHGAAGRGLCPKCLRTEES